LGHPKILCLLQRELRQLHSKVLQVGCCHLLIQLGKGGGERGEKGEGRGNGRSVYDAAMYLKCLSLEVPNPHYLTQEAS